ncbi:MAG TPA: GTPase ObgE [Anaerolineae bacterium]|nr:GTPase ObgE [Anaerolineae bacterium]HNT04704.1 GTPase ObgE [Anaerolineae bacterium]
MDERLFFDEATIEVRAGNGGNGSVSFRREKFVPLGGPSGGNGGKGGDVYVMANRRLNTLIQFQRQRHFAAEAGGKGDRKNMQGKSGEDLLIAVPPGTVVRDAASSELLADLMVDGQKLVVARGGRGGRGNAAFATPTNQAPRIAEKGEPGQARTLKLELKLIADVGIIGVPNAGKSTLLAAVSAARPKIADYPFTTLIPNLGVATVDDDTLVLADIPGLIEGAHDGAGLGTAFLKHIERTRVLIHLLDGDSPDPLKDYAVINQELELFSARLAAKPQVVALNKMDLPHARQVWPKIQQAMSDQGVPAFALSAFTGQGTLELLREVSRILQTLPPDLESPEEPKVFRPEESEELFWVTRERGHYRVRGRRIERVAVMTDWANDEAVARFQRILKAMGILDALQKAGVKSGDTVLIGEHELEWQ